MDKHGKRSRISRTSLFFLSTILACFVLIVMLLTVLYSQFQIILLDSLKNLNNSFAEQVNSTSQLAEETLRNFTNQIFYSQDVEKLRSYAILSSSQVIDGIRELNSYTATNPMIKSVYVLNGKQNYIYSTEQYGAVSNRAELFADETAAQMLNSRTADSRMKIIPRFSYAHSSYSNRLVYSFMFYELDADNVAKDNAIMLNISKEWFTRLYFGNNTRKSILIMDRNGNLIAASENANNDNMIISEAVTLLSEGNSQGYFICKDANGTKQACFYSEIKNHQWCYIKTIPYMECIAELKKAEDKTFLVVISIFSIICVIGVLLSFHIFVPFSKVRKRLADANPDQPTDTEHLLECLNILIENKSSSERVTESLQKVIKEEMLQAMINGTKPGSQPGERSLDHQLKISVVKPLYACLITGDDIERYIASMQENIHASESVVTQDGLTWMLMQPEDEAQFSKACLTLQTKYPLVQTIKSELVTAIENLPSICATMKEILRIKFMYPSSQVFEVKEYMEFDNSVTSLNTISSKLLQCLRRCSLSRAEECYQSFILELKGKTYHVVRFALESLGQSVVQLLADYSDAPGIYEPIMNSYQQMLENIRNIETLNSYFSDKMKKITLILKERRNRNHDMIITRISDYLKESFKDPQLSAQSAADNFNMSSAYICRVFRKAYKCSIMDYVNKLRIAEAEKIIATGQCRIKDIPAQIGITNTQYFFKLFKDISGCTPKQFQKERMKI